MSQRIRCDAIDDSPNVLEYGRWERRGWVWFWVDETPPEPTEEERRLAHNAYRRGERSFAVVAGERAYQRARGPRRGKRAA